ncbi:MAG: tetratricopeptide repeat protein [Planctomycetota bacterium]
MNRDSLVQRAQLLMSQSRPDQAAEELKRILDSDPNDAQAHALLSLCMSHNQDLWHDATREAEHAIHLAPDDSLSHYAHAVVLTNRNRFADANSSIEEALRLEPHQTEYYGLAGSIAMRQQQWERALDLATQGLAIDPDDEGCSALRSLALERLGRSGAALLEANAAVSRNPDSSEAHSMRGWAELQSGDYKAAQESFREALRLDPTDDFARSGMIQALNNNYFVFRIVFRFYSFLGRMAAHAQWAIIIGLFIGMRLLRGLAQQYPALKPFVTPISMLYLAFCLLSWIADPLFNTFLRFHSFGKYLLSERQRWSSNLVAAAIGLGALSSVGLVCLGDYGGAFLQMLCALFMTIPLSTVFTVDRGWPQAIAIVSAVGLGALYLAISVGLFLGDWWTVYFPIYVLGILVFSFAGNWLRSVTVRH